MFPLEQNHPDAMIFDDLSCLGDDNLLEELLAEHDEVTMPSNDLVNNNVNQCCSKKTRKRKSSKKDIVVSTVVVEEAKKGGVEGTKEFKKIMHREVERQRRLEMSSLFATLRSLLPVECIKGKRSTTDHMNEAVTYIKHMQKRSKAMRNRRDKLKNNVSSSSNSGAEGVIVNESTNVVKLNNFGGDGIEILISSDEAFPLSKVLKELLGRDLNVLTCVSSKANERTLQKIQIKANDSRCIDLIELQNHLASLIKFA